LLYQGKAIAGKCLCFPDKRVCIIELEQQKTSPAQLLAGLKAGKAGVVAKMEFRGLMGGFYRISEWIMRLSVTNLLWILTSLPVLIFVLGLFTVQGEEQVQALQASLLAMAVLSPFFLFPSTSAMFALARKWVTGDEDVSLLKTFFKSYKENYVQSMLAGIIFMVIYGVLFFNFRFYTTQTGFASLLSYLFLALMIILTLTIFNFFSIVVHLQMKTFQLLKNSFLITVGQPIRSVLIGVSSVIILWVSLTQFTFLLPFFTGSLIATVTFWHFNNGFRKIMKKHEEAQERLDQEAAEATVLQEEHPSDEEPAKKFGDSEIDREKYRTY
jgi:uncharacterized membrane protein YesL